MSLRASDYNTTPTPSDEASLPPTSLSPTQPPAEPRPQPARPLSGAVDVDDELRAIATPVVVFLIVVAVVVNVGLIVVFERQRRGGRLGSKVKLLILSISDLLFTFAFLFFLIFAAATNVGEASPAVFSLLQFYAVVTGAANRNLILYITFKRARIINLRRSLNYLTLTPKIVLKETLSYGVAPGFLVGIIIGAMASKRLLQNQQTGLGPVNYFAYGFLFFICILLMLGMATFILVKSKTAFGDRPEQVDFQNSVAAVAVIYCACNIPCTLVYFWRGVIHPRPQSDVPSALRSVQASAHILNSAANFFVYFLISQNFRSELKGFLQEALGRLVII